MATHTPHRCMVQAKSGRSLLQTASPPLNGDAQTVNTVGAASVLHAQHRSLYIMSHNRCLLHSSRPPDPLLQTCASSAF